jgi:hypothetical protein
MIELDGNTEPAHRKGGTSDKYVEHPRQGAGYGLRLCPIDATGPDAKPCGVAYLSDDDVRRDKGLASIQ